MLNKSKLMALGCLLTSCLLLVSCSRGHHLQKLQNYIQELKITAAKNKKFTLPPLHDPLPVMYQASSMRSPFESTQSLINNKLNQSNPLLIYPVSMLKFIGTVFKNDKMIAYITAPDNKIYQVIVGDNIGDHKGKVTEIFANRVEITEQDAESLNSTHVVKLQLKEGIK